MNISNPLIPFLFHAKYPGIRYAEWVLLISGVMGALYGLFSDIVWQPAGFTIAFTAFFVILNFVVALPVFGIHLLKFLFFRRGGGGVVRYLRQRTCCCWRWGFQF